MTTRRALAVLISVVCLPGLAAGQSRILRGQAVARPDGRTAAASVYLPAAYGAEPGRRFPALILLHGLGGEPEDWIGSGGIRQVLDEAIRRGIVEPLIAVMPDGGNGYWVDWPRGEPDRRYGSLVQPDLIGWMDSRFRTDGRRAIVGLSMGGFGALSIALRSPESFDAVVSLSGALFVSPPTGRTVYLRAFGHPGVGQWSFLFQNPLYLVQLGRAAGLPIWLDCGKDDQRKFTAGLRAVSRALTEEGVEHVARMRRGAHHWSVWRAGFAEALPWLSRHLKRAAPRHVQKRAIR